MKLKILVSIALFAAGFLLGWILSPRETAEPAAPPTTADAPAEPEIWTCPMHPEVEMPRRGKCRHCGMDLVLREQSDDGPPRVLTMSEEDKKLAEIVTARVERRYVTNQIRLVGKVDYDETRIKTISAWIPSGRLERMFVDYTGVPINAGDHLVLIYSPELLTAQEELLKAKRSVDGADRQPSEFLRQSDRGALESAREKLRLWGLTLEQITAIEERGTAEGDAPREGALIPDFRLLDFNGSPVQISALGKPVIVNFWASWCAACIEEMPDLERLHQAVGDRAPASSGASREIYSAAGRSIFICCRSPAKRSVMSI